MSSETVTVRDGQGNKHTLRASCIKRVSSKKYLRKFSTRDFNYYIEVHYFNDADESTEVLEFNYNQDDQYDWDHELISKANNKAKYLKTYSKLKEAMGGQDSSDDDGWDDGQTE